MNKRLTILTEIKNLINTKNSINNKYIIYYNNYTNISELKTFNKPIIMLFFDNESSERKTIGFNNSIDERELLINFEILVKSNNENAYELLEETDNFIYDCFFENKLNNTLNNNVNNIFYNGAVFDWADADNKINALTSTYKILYNYKIN